MKISPYAVFRRNRLTPRELKTLSFESVWLQIEDNRLLKNKLEEQSSVLSDVLSTEIACIKELSRPYLIAFRRDIHNGRYESACRRFIEVESMLSCDAKDAFAKWNSCAQKVRLNEARIQESWEEVRTEGKAFLKSIFAHDAIERSIQLSGPQLYQDLKSYSQNDDIKRKPSKDRVLESSLVNFAFRAAYKPSPFGRFAEIGAFDPQYPGAAEEEAPLLLSSVTKINRLLINWILTLIPIVPSGIELGEIILNSTVEVREDSIVYIGVMPGTWQTGEISSESVVAVHKNAELLCVIDTLSKGPVVGSEVIQELMNTNCNQQQATEFLQGLLRLGVVFFRPAADDHDPEYAFKVRRMLASSTQHEIVAITREFDRILELELNFAEKSAEHRHGLLTRAHQAVENIAQIAKVSPPPSSIMKSLLYEDTPSVTRPQAWNNSTISRSMPSINSIWKLATLLDGAHERRFGMFSFACENFSGRDRVPFLDFFGAFSSLSADEQALVFTGYYSDAAAQFRDQRARALESIRNTAVISDNQVWIDPACINRAVEKVTGLKETRSITMRLQFVPDNVLPNGESIVVNGVLTGHGVYMSRFGSFIPDVKGWSLKGAQKMHLEERFPEQVDLNSVLGFNFNIHPVVNSSVINYPGARSEGVARSIRPADLEVRIDHERTEIRLFDPVQEKDIEIVPLNFMTPHGVPLLYRFLESFSPSNRYQWNLYADLLGEPQDLRSTPRLLIGDVVVERAGWTVSADEVPDLEALSRDDNLALERFDKWRLENRLPQEAFVTCQTEEERKFLMGRTGHANRSMSDFAHLRRASVHKPMYVDFRNPYSVRSFAKSALSRPNVLVFIRECLPSTADYDAGGLSNSPEEYFVEFNDE